MKICDCKTPMRCLQYHINKIETRYCTCDSLNMGNHNTKDTALAEYKRYYFENDDEQKAKELHESSLKQNEQVKSIHKSPEYETFARNYIKFETFYCLTKS